jgi:hypothetical protein
MNLDLNPSLKADDLKSLTAELDRGIHSLQGKLGGKPPLASFFFKVLGWK